MVSPETSTAENAGMIGRIRRNIHLWEQGVWE